MSLFWSPGSSPHHVSFLPTPVAAFIDTYSFRPSFSWVLATSACVWIFWFAFVKRTKSQCINEKESKDTYLVRPLSCGRGSQRSLDQIKLRDLSVRPGKRVLSVTWNANNCLVFWSVIPLTQSLPGCVVEQVLNHITCDSVTPSPGKGAKKVLSCQEQEGKTLNGQSLVS